MLQGGLALRSALNVSCTNLLGVPVSEFVMQDIAIPQYVLDFVLQGSTEHLNEYLDKVPQFITVYYVCSLRTPSLCWDFWAVWQERSNRAW